MERPSMLINYKKIENIKTHFSGIKLWNYDCFIYWHYTCNRILLFVSYLNYNIIC